eukprot:8254606-Pyramimonas_sp.AAC.1
MRNLEEPSGYEGSMQTENPSYNPGFEFCDRPRGLKAFCFTVTVTLYAVKLSGLVEGKNQVALTPHWTWWVPKTDKESNSFMKKGYGLGNAGHSLQFQTEGQPSVCIFTGVC